MEPFGLFQFLQSFLNQNPPTNNAETAPPPPVEAEEPIKPEPIITQNQNAALQFMAAHDERAKRTRKP